MKFTTTYIFCGKGGVGKTTLSVELANYLNEYEPTICLGLDQQQNHRDLIKSSGYDVPFEVIDNKMSEFVEYVVDNTMLATFKPYASLVAPDFIAVCNIAELFHKIKGKYKNIVLDYPPNHAGINMVQMPPLLDNLGYKVITLKSRIKRMVKGNDYLIDNSEYISKILVNLQDIFMNAKWIPVGICTDLALLETERMITTLETNKLSPHKIAINMVEPLPESECDLCFARYEFANQMLAKYEQLGKKHHINCVQIPFLMQDEGFYDILEDFIIS